MMVISGDFTNIIAANTQPKADNKKSAQSDQSSQASFDEILHKNEGDRSATLKDTDRQSAKVASDKSLSDKAYPDKSYADKVNNDKVSTDKAANDELATDKNANNDKGRLNEVAKQNASQAKNSVSDKAQKQQENAKTSVQHEADDREDHSASAIHDILQQMDEQKAASSIEKNAAGLNLKNDEKRDQSGLNGIISKDKVHSSKGKNDKSDDVDGNSQENAENSHGSDIGQLATVDHIVVNQDNHTNDTNSLGGDKTTGDIDQAQTTDKTVVSSNNAVNPSDNTVDPAVKNGTDFRLTAVEQNGNKNEVHADATQISGLEGRATEAFGKFKGDEKLAGKADLSTGNDDDRGQSEFTLENGGKTRNRRDDAVPEVADSRADRSVSGRKLNGERRTQNNINQTSVNGSQQVNFEDMAEKSQAGSTLNVGDRVATTNPKGVDQTQLGRITGVEVTENRQVGDLRVLRIKLNPENLGMVEARLRKTSDGLHIEIHAERQETARLLAADHHALHKALEKSGFNDDGRLTIMVVDRSSQTVQQGQSTNSGQSMSQQDNGGQNFNGQQRQFSGQQGQGGHNGSRQTFTEFPVTGTPLQEEGGREERTVRNPRRLVV